jgi:flagellar biosynthesis GTPase FlhF
VKRKKERKHQKTKRRRQRRINNLAQKTIHQITAVQKMIKKRKKLSHPHHQMILLLKMRKIKRKVALRTIKRIKRKVLRNSLSYLLLRVFLRLVFLKWTSNSLLNSC